MSVKLSLNKFAIELWYTLQEEKVALLIVVGQWRSIMSVWVTFDNMTSREIIETLAYKISSF